jgi:two-component system cell cycle sensor histidine kinase/response regulator CckA
VVAKAPVVLVADDEPVVREMARRILEGAGYQVVEARDGAEAVALLERGTHVDLLMADLEMPNLSGEEMVQRIRATERDLKVLYVSGVVDRLLDARPMLWEGEAYLEKPFTPAGLEEAVSLLYYGHTRKPPL